MAAYIKKIAVIKQVKGGFAADGGSLSGLVKAETYAGFLKVEASLINFAPITEGRYVLGISDGLNTVTFEGRCFEGEQDFNLADGFAFLVCFCKNGASPIASAACGQMACALPDLKEEIKKRENLKPPKGGVAYDDGAIAEDNYYERNKADKGDSAVLKGEEQKEEGNNRRPHEEDIGALTRGKEDGSGKVAEPHLAGGDFYSCMRGEIERIFTSYPREHELEAVLKGSRFSRISYGEGRYYVFGVLSSEGKPEYICYGVPARGSSQPPPSLKNCSTYLPTPGGGYFITYQDAATGANVKPEQT